MWMILHDSGLLAVGNARKLHPTGSRLISRCRAALSVSPIAPCSPPSGRSPRRAAQGAGYRPTLAPGPPLPPGCPAGRKPGCSPGSSCICTGNRACASSGRPGRSTAPSSRSLPSARGRENNRSSIPRPLPRRVDHQQDASGCRGRSHGARLLALAQARPRRPGGPHVADSPGPAPRSSRGADGPGVRGRPDSAIGLGAGYAPVVPPRRSRVEPWASAREMYKRRTAIERVLRRLKGFRRIFSRFEKLDVIFLRFVVFALIINALR